MMEILVLWRVLCAVGVLGSEWDCVACLCLRGLRASFSFAKCVHLSPCEFKIGSNILLNLIV